MPMPFGWFQIAWSDEIETGSAKKLYYFGRHLVAWRDDEGAAHVWDAFCPHMGAHLGIRSTIKGCELTCALHGWTYDAAGECVEVPYSGRVNKQAKVRTYPVAERNGQLFAWYHPEDVAPSWDVPELPEFGADSGYSEVFRREYTLQCHWQEVAETQVDAAHIQAHLVEYQVMLNGGVRPDEVQSPKVDSYETDGPVARVRIAQDFPTPKGAAEGRIDTDVFGPGFAATWFTGLVDTLLIGACVPIDEGSCELRYSFVVQQSGDAESTNALGEAFISEIHERTAEDVEVWEGKAYEAKPRLIDTDGPIMQYRRWCEQFYVEGVDRSRDEWEPETSVADNVSRSAGTQLAGASS